MRVMNESQTIVFSVEPQTIKLSNGPTGPYCVSRVNQNGVMRSLSSSIDDDRKAHHGVADSC